MGKMIILTIYLTSASVIQNILLFYGKRNEYGGYILWWHFIKHLMQNSDDYEM